MDQEAQILFKGRVQGVGFRWTVLDHAERQRIVGTVKNLKNGEVEVIAQGSKEQIEAFICAVQEDSGSALITSVETRFSPAVSVRSSFTIIY